MRFFLHWMQDWQIFQTSALKIVSIPYNSGEQKGQTESPVYPITTQIPWSFWIITSKFPRQKHWALTTTFSYKNRSILSYF